MPRIRQRTWQRRGGRSPGRSGEGLDEGADRHARADESRSRAQSGLRTNRTICQVVLMGIPRDGRRFLLADTGITIGPTLQQKADILQSLVEVATVLRQPGSADLPRVAVMAASEKVSEAMPDTLDAAELARRNARGDFPGCLVEGPLSFDLAYAADAGEKKKIAGDVVGRRRCDALSGPLVGQPDGESDHVHRRLPLRRPALGSGLPGCVHVAGRHCRHAPQFPGLDAANAGGISGRTPPMSLRVFIIQRFELPVSRAFLQCPHHQVAMRSAAAACWSAS